MLERNRVAYLERSPLGPGWYACEVAGNRVIFTGPCKSEAEAKKVSDAGRRTAGKFPPAPETEKK